MKLFLAYVLLIMSPFLLVGMRVAEEDMIHVPSSPTLEETVRELGKQGIICKVYGHHWNKDVCKVCNFERAER
jgi:hypothetical protein